MVNHTVSLSCILVQILKKTRLFHEQKQPVPLLPNIAYCLPSPVKPRLWPHKMQSEVLHTLSKFHGTPPTKQVDLSDSYSYNLFSSQTVYLESTFTFNVHYRKQNTLIHSSTVMKVFFHVLCRQPTKHISLPINKSYFAIPLFCIPHFTVSPILSGLFQKLLQ